MIHTISPLQLKSRTNEPLNDDLTLFVLPLFLLGDFIYYWFHRCNLEIRLFWAGHVNHHSSQHLNFGTALRQGVGERIHKMIFWLPLPLLGDLSALAASVCCCSLVARSR